MILEYDLTKNVNRTYKSSRRKKDKDKNTYLYNIGLLLYLSSETWWAQWAKDQHSRQWIGKDRRNVMESILYSGICILPSVETLPKENASWVSPHTSHWHHLFSTASCREKEKVFICLHSVNVTKSISFLHSGISSLQGVVKVGRNRLFPLLPLYLFPKCQISIWFPSTTTAALCLHDQNLLRKVGTIQHLCLYFFE